jgi:hypothetical protein
MAFAIAWNEETHNDEPQSLAPDHSLGFAENQKNKAMENPGADALLKKLGGPAGL